MLTRAETKYLAAIPKDRTVRICPFDAVKVERISESIVERVRKRVTEVWEIKFLGASALGIAGQKDIDVFLLCPADSFKLYLPSLTREFGQPKPWKTRQPSIDWEWEEDGYAVELSLTSPHSPATRRQLKVLELLQKDPALLAEYGRLKQGFDGKGYHDYQKAKYGFYNRMLKEG